MCQHFIGRALGNPLQHHDDLAPHVQPGIIVETLFRRIDAKACEHQRRRHIGAGVALAGADNRFGAMRPHRLVAGLGRYGDAGRAIKPRFGQRDRLEPAAILGTGLEPCRSELRGHIARADIETPRAGAAAFEQIIGEERDMCLHPIR